MFPALYGRTYLISTAMADSGQGFKGTRESQAVHADRHKEVHSTSSVDQKLKGYIFKWITCSLLSHSDLLINQNPIKQCPDLRFLCYFIKLLNMSVNEKEAQGKFTQEFGLFLSFTSHLLPLIHLSRTPSPFNQPSSAKNTISQSRL